MRAMILAAGLGTRLLPLTNVRPKVLIPVRGTTVLDFWAERLYQCGFDSAILNAYHLKEQLIEAVTRGSRPISIVVNTEPVLLGTGGGIRSALGSLSDEPCVIVNGDIICDAPLDRLYAEHLSSGALVSMLMHDWPEFNNVAVGEDGSILGFGKEAHGICSGRNGILMLAFTGIHFVNPSALREYPAGVPGDILNIYRDLIARGAPPKALFSPGLFWREMGSIQSYMGLSRELGDIEPGALAPLSTGRGSWIHPEASIAPNGELKGTVVVGKGTRILEGARLEDVILWEDIIVEAGSYLKNCIVADGMSVGGRHSEKVFVPGQG